MGSGNVSIGRVRGIDIRINWTWVPVFVLVAWSLASSYFPSHFKHWSGGEYVAVSVAAALALFACVLIHELAHSIVAQSRGLPVGSITLYIFGGVSDLSKEPSSPGEEFWIAAAGPLSSIGLGVGFGLLHLSLHHPDWLSAIFGYLGAINLILALFNLIPAFPLDGGRVFRSVVWGFTHDMRRGTRIATRVAQGFSWLFIGVGLWQMLVGNFVGGLWLAFIGWFLNNMATGSYRQAQQAAELRDVDVRDVMSPDPVQIAPDTPLLEVVSHHLFQPGTRAVLVADNGELSGLLTVSDIRHFTPDQWSAIHAWRAMTKAEELDTVRPDANILDAIDIMNKNGHNQLPVVEDGHAAGMLSRSDLLRFVQIRHELGLPGPRAMRPPSKP